MKKNLIFGSAMLVIGIMLSLLKVTGMGAHIAISIVGVFVLAAFTAVTKKTWKIPALEIAMRAFYGIALITGIVVMNVSGLVAVAVVHKVACALFLALLVASSVINALSMKKD